MNRQKDTYKGISFVIENTKDSTCYRLEEVAPIFGKTAFIGVQYRRTETKFQHYTKQHVKKVIDRFLSLYHKCDVKPSRFYRDETFTYRGFSVQIAHNFEFSGVDIYDIDEITPVTMKRVPTGWYDMIKGHTFTENFVKIMIDFQLKLKGKQDYKAEEIESHDWEEAKPLLDILKQKGTDVQCVLMS